MTRNEISSVRWIRDDELPAYDTVYASDAEEMRFAEIIACDDDAWLDREDFILEKIDEEVAEEGRKALFRCTRSGTPPSKLLQLLRQRRHSLRLKLNSPFQLPLQSMRSAPRRGTSGSLRPRPREPMSACRRLWRHPCRPRKRE